MARDQITDFLLSNRFHLLDVSLTIPPVLIPIWGFTSISAPEMTVSYREIKEGNYEFPRKVVERASVSVLTLENGSQIFNSGFWDWISKMPEGNYEKKDLLLMHLTGINPTDSDSVGIDIGGFGVATGEFAFRVPGKAWLLKNCAAARYKAGSDFSSMGGSEVSIQQLDLEYEEFLEFNVGIG